MRCIGGDVDGGPCADRGFFTAESKFDLTLEQRKHLLEIVPVRRRSPTGWQRHVNQTVTARSFGPTDEDRVSVTDNNDMSHLQIVLVCDCHLALRVIFGDENFGLRRRSGAFWST